MSEETLFYQEEPAGEVLQQVASQLRLSLANIHKIGRASCRERV